MARLERMAVRPAASLVPALVSGTRSEVLDFSTVQKHGSALAPMRGIMIFICLTCNVSSYSYYHRGFEASIAIRMASKRMTETGTACPYRKKIEYYEATEVGFV